MCCNCQGSISSTAAVINPNACMKNLPRLICLTPQLTGQTSSTEDTQQLTGTLPRPTLDWLHCGSQGCLYAPLLPMLLLLLLPAFCCCCHRRR